MTYIFCERLACVITVIFAVIIILMCMYDLTISKRR
jgi:hypothetical protein